MIDAFDPGASHDPGGPNWLELRYEDFVASPRERTAQILGFLGLEWDPVFEEGFSRYTFETGRTDAFRTDLGLRDVAALNDSLGSHLSRYGYAVTGRARGGDNDADAEAR